MSMASQLAWRMTQHSGGTGNRHGNGPKPKHGEAIFDDNPLYPHQFSDLVGQEFAKLQLLTSMSAANKRGRSLPHVLIASGLPGVGKTTLAKIVAYTLDVGFLEIGPNVAEVEAIHAIMGLRDGDVVFVDEIHRLVSRGKSKIEWMLTALQDGTAVLPTGVVTLPRVTFIAATTDKEKLPSTILDRFPIQPLIEPYTDAESIELARGTATRMGFGTPEQPMLPEVQLQAVCAASDNNPRRIGHLLSALADIAVASDSTTYDVALALKWRGLSEDGLPQVAQDYLMLMLGYGGTAALPTMKAALNEEALQQTERTLIQKGYLQITARGRCLTPLGMDRADALLDAAEGK